VRRILSCIVILLVFSLVLVACDDESVLMPTPVYTFTPGPTTVPQATVGPLNPASIAKLGISLVSPAMWKPPALLNDNSYVISQDGSTDTSSTAGPFVLLIVGDSNYFHSKLSFPAGLTDPVDQLNAIVAALNLLGPEIGIVVPYTFAKYPGAIVRTYERGNEMTITLLKGPNDKWVYIGAQAKEVFFKYYEDNVFSPIANALTLS
jgi:hypothetical protein